MIFDTGKWLRRSEIPLDLTATRYMMELGYYARKTDEQYEDIRDAFIVGYKRGLQGYLNGTLSEFDEWREDIRKERASIERRKSVIERKRKQIEKALEEIKELKAALKKGFTIRQVADDEDSKVEHERVWGKE